MTENEVEEKDNNKTEVAPEETAKEKDTKIPIEKKRFPWFLAAIISILCSVLSVFVYDRYFAQKVVTFDLKGFIGEQRDLYLAGKLTDEQFKANLDNIEAIMKGIPKRKVVLMGDAVIRNAEVVGKQNSNSETK